MTEELRTWDGGKRCDECCTGDRCDDPTHRSREHCPHCKGTGWALWTTAGRRDYAAYLLGGNTSEKRAAILAAVEAASPPTIPAEVGRRAMERLEHISRRLQMDIDDGSSPDQLSMEDLVCMAAKSITELQQYLSAQEQGEKERI